MTIQEAAATAIDIQDACNLSGVVHTFARILADVLWPEANRIGGGTAFVNTHSVSVLFAAKIADLAHANGLDGVGEFEQFSVAYHTCQQLAGTSTAADAALLARSAS